MRFNSSCLDFGAGLILASAVAIVATQALAVDAQPLHKCGHTTNVAPTGQDTHVAALLKLINDRSLQSDVSNLKHLALRLDNSGQPVSLAITPKTKSQPCKNLEKRVRAMSFPHGPQQRSQRIDVTILGDTQEPKPLLVTHSMIK